MLSNKQKQEMYGDMTEDEIKLVYQHIGHYKGWTCYETGCGYLIFTKGDFLASGNVRAYRGTEVKNWIPECWKECKQKIDEQELCNG